ncbi:MAG: LOG family protein [Acidobacteriota bacterium]
MTDLTPLLAGQSAVTIFGSGDARAGEDLYEQARQAGARLARAGLAVLNGGYGGVMEAVSRGAREAGGKAIGVTLEPFSRRRSTNPWLSDEIREPDLHLRMRTLIDRSSGFLVLEGKAGTLAEVGFLWALTRAQLMGHRTVVLVGSAWCEFLAVARRLAVLDETSTGSTQTAASVEQGVSLLLENLP